VLATRSALGSGPWSQFQAARIAGRSSVLFVEPAGPDDGRSRLVVKQPRADWRQDDLASPVLAEQEFRALTRLHAHFRAQGGRLRVPAPAALLPEVDAFVMEYVAGRSLRELLTYRSLLRPAPLLDGLAAAAEFIAAVHDVETLPGRQVDLQREAQTVIAVVEQKLRPVGLMLPRRVTEILHQVPRIVVDARQVWLHGDFGPENIILAEDGSTVGIDAALDTVGLPEDDLVRFIALMSGAIRFAPELFAPALSRIRRRLEEQLLGGYYGTTSYPPLFELKLIDQLARRWLRLREHAQQHRQRSLLPVRLRVIEAQIRLLTEESAQRLVHGLGL